MCNYADMRKIRILAAVLAISVAAGASAGLSIFSISPSSNGVSLVVSAVGPASTNDAIDCYHSPTLAAGLWRWVDAAPITGGLSTNLSLFVPGGRLTGTNASGNSPHGIGCAATTNVFPCPVFSGHEVTNIEWGCVHAAMPQTAFFRLGDRTDSDGDGLADAYEGLVMGTDPAEPDTDHDSIHDCEEALLGLNPTNFYDTVEDYDGDGLPNVFEFFNGTNPFLADYDDAPRIVAGTNAALGELSLSNAFAASTPYSIVEVRPGRYSGPEWAGLDFPPHPLLLTSTNGFNNHDTVICAPASGNHVFRIRDGQDLHTIVQGLTIDLKKDSTAQLSAFIVEPSATGTGSGAYFRNIHARLSGRGVERGWWVSGPSSNTVVIASSMVEFVPSRNGQAIYVSNPPPIFLDGITVFNSGARNASRALYLRGTGTGFGPVAVKNSVFDRSFGTNRVVYATGTFVPISFASCVVPMGADLHSAMTNNVVSADIDVMPSGMPRPASPALGAGAEYSHETADIRGTSRGDPPDIGAWEWREPVQDGIDTDGDGLSDCDECTLHSTSPWFADTDCDGIDDGFELACGTSPTNADEYSFTLLVTATNNTPFARTLSFGIRDSSAADDGVASLATSSGHPFAQFEPCGILVTNSSAKTAILFDDLNANGVFDAEDIRYAAKAVSVDGPDVRMSFILNSGVFDGDRDGMPAWWEFLHGLSDSNGQDARLDPDGDYLPNLQEYHHRLDPLMADGSNTVFAAASRSIDERIAGLNPATALPVFSNYPACGTNLVRNAGCWLYGVDTSCASPWHSRTPRTVEYKNTVTLISPRHFVTASHYDPSLYNGTILYFVGMDGVVYSNRYAGFIDVGNDIRVGKLANEMTNIVSVAKILPNDYEDYIPTVKGLPVFTLDQEEKAIVCELSANDMANVSMGQCSTADRQSFHEAAVDGDSSSPWFLLLNGQPVLLTTYHGPTSGPWLASYRGEIQAAMDILAPGYVLQIADLSEFQATTVQEVNQ